MHQNCKEELIACKFSEQCTDGFNRYLRCYDRYKTFIECQGSQLDDHEKQREISF